LTALKLGVAFASGSVGVLSEGVHSFLDLISAGVAFFTVREAGKPADEDHPFGHGKFETLSSLFESLLLIAAAVLIVSEAADHWAHPQPIAHQGLAMAVIGISLGVSYFMYRHNLSAAQENESSAIHVNALHFLADTVAGVAVLGGLIAIRLTGWLFLDPLMAFLVAGYIVVISAKQVKGALMELTDRQLPEAEIKSIQGMIDEFRSQPGQGGMVIEAHDLRTRKSGSTRHVDFHLVVCGKASVEKSHEVCDQIEERIMSVFPRASVNIHVEPCETLQRRCPFCGQFKNGAQKR
jgi:cation diffusion facilitator family transporter